MNVFQHAAPHNGAHVVVSYDRDSRVRLGVADCGEGVVADMRTAHQNANELSDVQMVQAALEAEISGSRTEANRGVGLVMTRRLALAADGAMWLMTGDVVARSSAGTATAWEPEVVQTPGFWHGTAVALSFKDSAISDFQAQMLAIRNEIEGKGPSFAMIRFVKRKQDAFGEPVAVHADGGRFALDRDRAMKLQADVLMPLMASCGSAVIDFSLVKHASQGFCHGLLAQVVKLHGMTVLQRLTFAACSPQVQIHVRSAIEYGLRSRDEATPA
jgi:hypothetical protein